MKKLYMPVLMLFIVMGTYAQKLTVKTANGQSVEITCEGLVPAEVVVINDSVVFRMPTEGSRTESQEEEPEVTSDPSERDSVEISDNVEPAISVDTLGVDSLHHNLVPSTDTSMGGIINSLVEDLSPEYAEFNKEHEGTKPASEKELVEDVAKKLVGDDVVETADLLGTIFGFLRFTKDPDFKPTYAQRSPKPLIRTYDIIELSGNLSRDIENAAGISEKINAEDYGDDTENENKYGGGIKYSRVYMKGTEIDGQWQPNPLGFAWSWGGLLAYSYEKDLGSSISAMGKVGVQIGNDIAIGIDALLGCGVSPYKTFLTNGMNHSLINRSAFCVKYGVQIWGSLNFSKDTYTAIFGRYIYSARPNSGLDNLPKGWELVLENFDPSSWTVGLAVGYKFGAPQPLSQDKRLQVGISTGYNLTGNKGLLISAEIERLTQVSPSTTLSYGLAVEDIFSQKENKECYGSVLLSAGFKVRQPMNRWFWGAKLYGGIGDYDVIFVGSRENMELRDDIKKICGRAALQLSTGYSFGKCNEIFMACRAGYHFGKHLSTDSLEDSYYENLTGFDLDIRTGYKLTF